MDQLALVDLSAADLPRLEPDDGIVDIDLRYGRKIVGFRTAMTISSPRRRILY